MNIEDLIVSAVVFGAIYYLGNRFFKKKDENSCGCGDEKNCKH